MTLLRTRLIPPRRERGVIGRDIVPSVLEQMRGKRLTVVRAPAGYGKSLLLGQLHERLAAAGEAVGWISTAELDGSARELALYIATALAPALPAALPSEIPWLFSRLGDSDLPAISMALCNTLHGLEHAVTLFLDDVHALDGTDALRLLARLVHDAPHLVRLAVATRSQPAFPLSRLRAHGELLELGIEQLRFSEAETVRFLNADRGEPSSAERSRLAHARSEGWAAGLQLFVLTAGSSDSDTGTERARGFSGADRSVRDYLDHDVLVMQPEPVRAFLLHTGVLREFTAEICDEMLDRQDSREVIARLEAAGLFIFSLDTTGDWFRYHHLFREFLERRLRDQDPQALNVLHAKAARCFRARGHASEALYHACAAGDLALAAAVLDDSCEESFYQGKLWSLAGWIRRVPEALLDTYPRMQLARVWSLTLELKFNDADDILQRVSGRIDAGVAEGSISAQAARDLDRVVLHRRMMLAQFRDDLPETERLCNKLLVDFPNDEEPFLRGSLDASLANAHRELYRVESLDRLDKSAREYFGRTGMSYPLVFHESIIGSCCLQRGSAAQASRCYEAALGIATAIAGDTSALAAMPALLLAQLQLERCEFAAARARLEKYLPLAGGVGFVEQLIAGYVGRARLAALEEDFDLAEELLTRGNAAAAAGGFGRLHWHVVAERIRERLGRRDLDGAHRVAARAGLPASADTLRPQDGVTSTTEMMALAWMRLKLAEGDARQSADLARRWIDFAERRDCLRTELRMRVVHIAARFAQGDANAAMRLLADATARAAQSGYALPFVEEGEAVRAALVRLLDADHDTPAKDLARSLAVWWSRGARPLPAQEGLAHDAAPFEGTADGAGLNQREIDILRRVAAGALNKEVGAQLGLTEGTVKWYLQQIYRKLGAQRRVDAVRKARSIGLVR